MKKADNSKLVSIEFPEYLEDTMRKFARQIIDADVYEDDMITYLELNIKNAISDANFKREVRDMPQDEREKQEQMWDESLSKVSVSDADIQEAREWRGTKR